jgi:hypothetical protein
MFWTAFLRKLARSGLRCVKLVISDAHEGIKAAVAKVLNATGNAAASTSYATISRTPTKADAVPSPPSSPPPSRRGRLHPIGAGSPINSVQNCPG